MSPVQTASARAEALFVSAVQFSEAPSIGDVRLAIARSLREHGIRGCAARAAQEYGEHPLESVARMALVLRAIRAAYRGDLPDEPVAVRRRAA